MNKKIFLIAYIFGVTFYAFGQNDDFSGGLSGWTQGEQTGLFDIRDGGPQGTGDSYLHVRSTGGGGQGSKLVIFNSAQWSGDKSAGQTINVQLRNFGTTPLTVRIRLEGSGGSFVSNQGIALASGSGWTPASFSLEASNFTGGTDFTATLANLTRFRIFHNPNPTFPPPGISGELGIDDVALEVISAQDEVDSDGTVRITQENGRIIMQSMSLSKITDVRLFTINGQEVYARHNLNESYYALNKPVQNGIFVLQYKLNNGTKGIQKISYTP